MRIQRLGPARYSVELHAYELAGLVAAARWTIEAGSGDLPEEAIDELRKIVASCDAEIAKLGS